MTLEQIKLLNVPLNHSKSSINHSNGVAGKVLGWANIMFQIGLIRKLQTVRVVDVLPANCVLGNDAISAFCLQQNKDLSVCQDLDSVKIEINYVSVQEEEVTIAALNFTNTKYSDYLKKDQQQRLDSLITKYEELYAKHKFDVGTIRGEECTIELSDRVPVALRPYRASPIECATMAEQIEHLLKHNLIAESNSPYAAPVVLAYKKDEHDASEQEFRRAYERGAPRYSLPQRIRLLCHQIILCLTVRSGLRPRPASAGGCRNSHSPAPRGRSRVCPSRPRRRGLR